LVSPLDAVLELAAKEAAMIDELWKALHDKDYATATQLADKLVGKKINTSPVLCGN
jgi:hypothetical protein